MYAYTSIYYIQYTATLVGNLPWSNLLGVFPKFPTTAFHTDLKVELLVGNLWPSPFKEMRHDVLLTCGNDGQVRAVETTKSMIPRFAAYDTMNSRATQMMPSRCIHICCVMLYNQLENKNRYQYHLHFCNFYFDGNAPRISLIRTSESVIPYTIMSHTCEPMDRMGAHSKIKLLSVRSNSVGPNAKTAKLFLERKTKLFT